MTTLIFFLFCRLIRATFSSLTAPNRSPKCCSLPIACTQPCHIIERVDKTQIRVFLETIDRGIGCLDVEVGDVIWQDRHLVGVKLFQIFVPELLRLAAEMLDQLGEEGAGACGWVEDFDILVDESLAEMLLAQPVGA